MKHKFFTGESRIMSDSPIRGEDSVAWWSPCRFWKSRWWYGCGAAGGIALVFLLDGYGRKRYLEPFDDPSFGWSFGLVLRGLTFKHRGHWGSRYMLDWCILADIPHRFQLKHFFCWGWFCQGVSFNELQGGSLGLDFTERHVQGRAISFRDGNHIPHTSNLAQKHTNSSTYLALYFSRTLTLLAVSLFINPMDPSTS